jgi:hypothetical protein
MPLFNRKRNDTQDTGGGGRDNSSSDGKKEKGAWRKPANTAFKQQRLKAWQPILTPKTVLPTLFIIGVLFAPIGGLLIWGSSLVSELTFDYTECENLNPSASFTSPDLVDMPKYNYRLRSRDDKARPAPPQYAFFQNPDATDIGQRNQCIVQFDVPADLDHTVLLYYKLTNFYQNHRRYVKSLDADQLKGKARNPNDLNSGDCKPLAKNSEGKAIYPCGLIANSVFNDTFTNLTLLNPTATAATTYVFSEKGIAWPGEAKKYVYPTKYDPNDIVPPPNWVARYPNWTTENLPDLHNDEHFQNWMRTSGLPTFTKLWGRNDADTLIKGRYQIVVNLNYPVLPYKGTKSIVISTVSWIGGKNPFLGWAYVASAAVFVLLAVAGTVRHILMPRRLGDMSLLSWNR